MTKHYTPQQVENLKEFESLGVKMDIDIFYGEETHFCSLEYVPYGWQFPDEEACFLSDKSYRFNCFRFISRQSRCIRQVRGQNINTGFVVEHLEKFPFQIEHATSVVLDTKQKQ